jgi:hypothetical protein
MCDDYAAACSELKAQSKSREISGTLFQRIQAQMCLQPYHSYTNRKAGREIKKIQFNADSSRRL